MYKIFRKNFLKRQRSGGAAKRGSVYYSPKYAKTRTTRTYRIYIFGFVGCDTRV